MMVEEVEGDDPNIKSLFIDKGNGGFGFNIKGTTQFGGTMQAINGRLYPPLQYVSVVDPGLCITTRRRSYHIESVAYKGGLRANDRILEVNGRDARGAAHSVVVDWVIAGGSKLNIKVLGVSDLEGLRLRRLEESMEEDQDGARKAKVF